MADQEIPGAGAILLAAYFGIDTPTLGKILGPFLSRFPTFTGAILWNIVKLSCEEGKSIAEITAITGIDLLSIEEAKKCIDTLMTISSHANVEPLRETAGDIMMIQAHEEHAISPSLPGELDIATVLHKYDQILQFVETIIEQSDLPMQVVITSQKRIYQIRRLSDPRLSVTLADATNSALPQTTREQATRKLRRYKFMQNLTESLIHLINQLSKDLQSSLQEHQQRYITREQALQREFIPDLASFCAKEHKTCQDTVASAIVDAKKTLQEILDKSTNEVWSNITASLDRAKSSNDFAYFSRWTVGNILHEENDKLRKQLDQITSHIQQEINDATESSKKQFNDAHKKLFSIGYMNLSLMMVMDDPGEYIIFNDTSSELATTTDDRHQSDNWKTVDSTSLGAMIETFIAPGIGTLLGTTLGSFLGSFSLSLEKKREALREKLEPEIKLLYKQLQEQLDDALNSYEDALCYSLDQQINAYVRGYKARLEALNALQRYELQHLQQTIQSYLQQIRQYEEILQQLQQKLTKAVEEY